MNSLRDAPDEIVIVWFAFGRGNSRRTHAKGGRIKSYFINHRNENSLGANDIFCADEKKSLSFKNVSRQKRDTKVDVFYVDLFLICASFMMRGEVSRRRGGKFDFLKTLLYHSDAVLRCTSTRVNWIIMDPLANELLRALDFG